MEVLQSVEKIGGASRDRTDDLIVANDAVSQENSIWRALGSRLRSKTVQFSEARRELPQNVCARQHQGGKTDP